MFILLFLHFCKKSWQYFVLLLFFLWELFYYSIIFYFCIFGVEKLVSAIFFFLCFLYNIFSIYINFYFYLCLYHFVIGVVLLEHVAHVFIEQQNILILFFFFLYFLFLFKSIIYFCFFITKKLLIKGYTQILNFCKVLFETKSYDNSSFFNFWKSLTKILRLKHYKASIFFLYVFYISLIISLLLMNFNPVI